MILIRRVLLLILPLLLFCACTEQKAEDTYISEARIAFSNKEYLEAEKLYERYLRQVPEGLGRWEAWDRVAYIALNIRRDEGLTADILEAMALEYADRPEIYQDVLFRLTKLYEHNFRWQRALSAWQRFLATPGIDNEQQAKAHLHLAKLYQRRIDYTRTMRHLEACLGMDIPSSVRAEALYSLSMVYSDQGESKKAEEKLIELTTMPDAPNNIQVQGLFILADLMEEQERFKEALELFKSIESIYPNPHAVEVRIKGLEDRK